MINCCHDIYTAALIFRKHSSQRRKIMNTTFIVFIIVSRWQGVFFIYDLSN